jgi:hypothetical protein
MLLTLCMIIPTLNKKKYQIHCCGAPNPAMYIVEWRACPQFLNAIRVEINASTEAYQSLLSQNAEYFLVLRTNMHGNKWNA